MIPGQFGESHAVATATAAQQEEEAKHASPFREFVTTDDATNKPCKKPKTTVHSSYIGQH